MTFQHRRNELSEQSSDLRLLNCSSASVSSNPVGGFWKRALDVLVAAISLFLLLPVLVIVAVVLWSTIGSPVFYSQKRVGFNGRLFDCYKFRTMVTNSEELLHQHLALNPAAAEEWRQTQKLRDDPRVTRIGHLLRKTSIDELPQFFNVLKGDMSCVGPRPVVPDELQRYGEKAKQYLKSRPGITGPWQVSGRSKLTYEQRVAMDSTYVQNWSLLVDIRILVRTIPAVIQIDRTS